MRARDYFEDQANAALDREAMALKEKAAAEEKLNQLYDLLESGSIDDQFNVNIDEIFTKSAP